MNLNQINYVIKLAETKSFTKAARELYITQPTLSQQIKSLEDEFGVPLFNRSRGDVTLTKAGQDFLYYANRITNNINKLSASLDNYCSLETGSIHIGLLLTFGYTKIPSYISDFQKIHPKVDIKISVNITSILVEQLLNNELDIVFITGHSSTLPQTLEVDLVSQSEMMCVMNKDHHLSSLNYVVPEDLESERILMVDRHSFVYNELHQALHRDNLKPIIIGENSNADVALQIAQHNLALSFMSEEIINKSSHTNIIAKKMLPKLYRNIYVAVQSNLRKSPALQAFQSFIIEKTSINFIE